MRQDSLIIYLHGFASGPGSYKATLFRRYFASSGVSLVIPDLEGGDFRNLTVTSQINIIRQTIYENPAERYGLVGSSMGGYLALLTAQMEPRVRCLYLMCPGINFVSRWKKKVMGEFKPNEKFPSLIQVFNYRYNKIVDLNSSLFQDAETWDSLNLERCLPTRLVHGAQDEVVPLEGSRSFCQTRPWVELVELDSDHGLLSHGRWIVKDAFRFFQSQNLINGGQ